MTGTLYKEFSVFKAIIFYCIANISSFLENSISRMTSVLVSSPVAMT